MGAKCCFAKVAEGLYRNASSGIYYALVKRHSKQFHRSLKAADRKLANRRLQRTGFPRYAWPFMWQCH